MKLSLPLRWIISVLGMYGMALMFAERAALSISLVAMTSSSSSSSSSDSRRLEPFIGQHYCAETNSSSSDSTKSRLFIMKRTTTQENSTPEFDWNGKLQGFILGASFYLYLAIPALAGRLTDSFGGKWVIFAGLLGPCLLSALIPVATRAFGAWALILLQTLIGGFHGTLQASLFSLNTRWFPPPERPTTNAGILFGSALGSAGMSILAGYLCGTRAGWPLVFYVMSALHLPWLALWAYYCSSDPSQSQRVTDRELAYIRMNADNSVRSIRIHVPWRRILISVPVWCSVLTKCATSWGYFLLLSKVPSFLSTIFGIDIAANGTFTAAVTSATGISSLAAPAAANWIMGRLPRVRSIWIRKAFQTGAMLGPAVCLLALTFAECNLSASFGLIFAALFCYGLMTGGEYSLVAAFAPNLAGTVMGLVVILPFSMGFLGPYLVGLILDHETGSVNDRWNNIFLITAGIYVGGLVVFLLFATDEQQEWDKLDAPTEPKNKAIA